MRAEPRFMGKVAHLGVRQGESVIKPFVHCADRFSEEVEDLVWVPQVRCEHGTKNNGARVTRQASGADLFQRAAAAFFAIRDRLWAESLAALAGPPFRPPRRPSS